MIKKFCFFPLLGCALLLSGCLYDNPPSGPSQSIDTWLIGQWTATDKAGHEFTAVMAPASSSHYRLSLSRKGSAPQEFDGWIGRVDGFSILTLKSLNEGPSFGKYVLYHYELLSPGVPPPGGIGATRIRVSELQLDDSCQTLKPYDLRKAIRQALKDGTLLAAYDVAAARKAEAKEAASVVVGADLSKPETKINSETETAVEIPGRVIWTKTGGVTLSGETF